jgi:hypothetical protein
MAQAAGAGVPPPTGVSGAAELLSGAGGMLRHGATATEGGEREAAMTETIGREEDQARAGGGYGEGGMPCGRV